MNRSHEQKAENVPRFRLAHAQTSPAVTPGTGQMYRATSLRGSDAGRTALAGWVKRGYARCARRSSPPWVTRKEMYETQSNFLTLTKVAFYLSSSVRMHCLIRIPLSFCLLALALPAAAQWRTGYFMQREAAGQTAATIPWSKYTHVIHSALRPTYSNEVCGLDTTDRKSVV